MIEPRYPEDGLKALTLTQPWASLIALRQKTIETRSFRIAYRGELVIHAAKGFPKWAKQVCFEEPFCTALGGLRPDELPISRGLCVVKLLACIKTTEMHKVEAVLGRKPHVNEIHFGDYSEGRYAWVLEYVRPIQHDETVKGELGLWWWARNDQEKAENALFAGRAHL